MLNQTVACSGWSPVRALLRSIALIVWLLAWIPLVTVSLILRNPLHLRLVSWIWWGALTIVGVKVKTEGTICMAKPVFFISNHTSYLDIPILGMVLPYPFVAKDDIAKWPVLGWLSPLVQPVFVVRKRHHTKENMAKIKARLQRHGALVLFPEGTTSDGNRILPFNTAFFAAPEGVEDGLMFQPLSIVYTHVNGMPSGVLFRRFFAWIGDQSLLPHLWRLMGFQVVTAKIKFMKPVAYASFESRKALAKACETQVMAAFHETLRYA